MLLSVSSTMGTVLDVVIIALIAVFALIGFKKGFFKSVLALISTLATIIISILCASPFAKLLNKIYDFTGFIADKLSDGIASMGVFYSQPISGAMSGADVVSNIPSSTNGFLKKLMAYVLNPLSASDIQGLTVAEIVSGAFASIIMLILSAIILFILIKVVVALASRLFDNITRNRVFGATNKLLGLAFGAVKGFVVVIIFTIVLTMLTVIPSINTKITPIIQDNTKIARPIYNYTDEMVGKYIVDGKVVQKWIDNLWENKYKDRGDDTQSSEVVPDGTVQNPYQVEIVENEGVYIATITLDFTNADVQYYKLTPTTISTDTFSLVINSEAECVVTTSSDMDNALVDLSTLSKNETYIIKFEKGTNAQVQATLTLTPIN